MSRNRKLATRGFSLIEMMVALALGLIVIGASTELFSKGVNATWVTSQRAELQQDFRAASNLMVHDISLANAGIGPSNSYIALPSGTGKLPVYGTSIATGPIAYPTNSTGTPLLYGVIPGNKLGITVNAAQGPTDVITVAYTDNMFLLNCYQLVSIDSSGTFATFQLNAAPYDNSCTLPPGVLVPQPLDSPGIGLTTGDLVWFTVTKTGSHYSVLAEVTGISNNGGGSYQVDFASGDPLFMNQPAATGGMKALAGGTGSATRIFVISYFLDNSTGTPTLMRQVSGHTAVPVAENVTDLEFSYDLAANGAFYTSQADGGVSQGLTPNQITKINIVHMSMRSQLKGATGYQGLDLQTSVSGRDLTFTNEYDTD